MIKFFLVRLKRFLHKKINHFRFYSRFGIVLPENCIANGIDNIKVGSNFTIGQYCQIYCQDKGENPGKIVIGDNVALNSNVILNADMGGNISIGDNVLIGPNVLVRAANHIYSDKNSLIRDQGHQAEDIHIGSNVWIGGGVIVLPGVKIGDGCVIGAGSVVTKNIESYTVALGSPAKAIKVR